VGILHNRALGRSIDRDTKTPEIGEIVSQPQVRSYEDMTLAEKRRYNFARARAAKAAKRASS